MPSQCVHQLPRGWKYASRAGLACSDLQSDEGDSGSDDVDDSDEDDCGSDDVDDGHVDDGDDGNNIDANGDRGVGGQRPKLECPVRRRETKGPAEGGG